MRRGVVVPLALLALLLAAGCARRTGGPVPSPSAPPAVPPAVAPAPPAPPPAPAAPPAAAPAPASPADLAFSEGEKEMKAGNYERALEMFSAAWKESPGHAGVSRDFPEALHALKVGGDDSYRQGRLEDAAKLWSAALRFVSHPAEKGKPLSLTRNEIRSSIDRVSSTLMEKGLMEYRKGNLEAAIAVWKSILSYDPSNAEAARSVQTATTQLENLKKIPPPK